MKGLLSIAFPKNKHFWFNIYQPVLGLSHLMKCTHQNYGIIWRKHSPDVLKCLGAFISFLQVILISWGQVITTHELCSGDAWKCASVLEENSSASLYTRKKIIKGSQKYQLCLQPHKLKWQTCVHAHSKFNGNQDTQEVTLQEWSL